MLGFERQRRQRVLAQCVALARHHVLDIAHQARPETQAAAGQGGGGAGQLQHREVVVALPDTQRDGLAGIPALLLGAFVVALLPVGGRQHAGELAVEVDLGAAAEAKGFELVVDQIHAHLAGQRVEVDVARLDDRALHVHRAQALVAVAAEDMTAKDEAAAIVDHRGRAALATVQRRNRHEGLEGGARRVGAAQGAVEQGLVQALVELAPALVVDAVDEQVGVEIGLAHQRQHFAVAWVDGNEGAAAVAEKLFDQGLQPDVYRQHQLVARRRRMAGEPAHRVAAGGLLDLLVAGAAVQLVLIVLLQAELADDLGAPVVALLLVRPVLDALLLGRIDATDVADQVARRFAQRVVAEQSRVDVRAREAEALCHEARHLGVAQAVADRHRFEALAFFKQAAEASAVSGVDGHHLRQAVDQRIQRGLVADFRGRNLQRIG